MRYIPHRHYSSFNFISVGWAWRFSCSRHASGSDRLYHVPSAPIVRLLLRLDPPCPLRLLEEGSERGYRNASRTRLPWMPPYGLVEENKNVSSCGNEWFAVFILIPSSKIYGTTYAILFYQSSRQHRRHFLLLPILTAAYLRAILFFTFQPRPVFLRHSQI